MDKIGFILLALLLIVIYFLCFHGSRKKSNSKNENDSESEEGMAPLGWGTYKNNYPRGKCVKQSLDRKPCEIGSCPMHSMITNEKYCSIQCAQLPDKESRQKCYSKCINMMKGGCE